MCRALSQTATNVKFCFLLCYQNEQKYSAKQLFDGFELLSCMIVKRQNSHRLAIKFDAYTVCTPHAATPSVSFTPQGY